jgi:hypothetical protein
MMRTILIAAIIFGFALPGIAQDAPQPKQPDYLSNQVLHPEWFIKITDWSFFSAARVGMLSSVVIENTADIAYKDIEVRVSLYTYSPPAVGQTVTNNTSVLPITLPPKSKKKYLKGGIPIGGGSQSYRVSDIQVLSATPITN